MATKRYDVFIENNDPEDQSSLILMKFPAMRSQLDNPSESLQLSVRPKSLKMKLQVALDPKSPEFHLDKAESLATKSVPKTFANNFVDKNIYLSSKHTVDDGQLFAAMVVNDQLACQPISHIITMRSDLSHFDVREESDVKEEVRPVSVKFAGPERSSFAPKASIVKEDPDDQLPDEEINLSFTPSSSENAQSERDSLFGSQIPIPKIEPGTEILDKKPHIYHPDVKPKLEKVYTSDIFSIGAEHVISSQGAPSTSHIRQSSVKKIVRECLMKAKIVSFEELYEYIKRHRDSKGLGQLCSKDMLDALSELAILVQGNWIIKSEVLYRDGKQRDLTDESGVSLNLFIAARDYLLWLFSQNREVNRLEYSRIVRLPERDILGLLKQLAIFNSNSKNWELKLPTDSKFISSFPDYVQRQANLLKVRRANKLSIFD